MGIVISFPDIEFNNELRKNITSFSYSHTCEKMLEAPLGSNRRATLLSHGPVLLEGSFVYQPQEDDILDEFQDLVKGTSYESIRVYEASSYTKVFKNVVVTGEEASYTNDGRVEKTISWRAVDCFTT